MKIEDYKANFRKATGIHSHKELCAIGEALHLCEPLRIVEFGTGGGLMTSLLGEYAMHRKNCLVYSLDLNKLLPLEVLYDLAQLPVIIANGNEYNTQELYKIQVFLEQGPRFVYCDGGNKPQEVKLMSRLLESGDFLACHDFERTEEEDEGLLINSKTDRVYLKDIEFLLQDFEPIHGDVSGASAPEDDHVLILRKI